MEMKRKIVFNLLYIIPLGLPILVELGYINLSDIFAQSEWQNDFKYIIYLLFILIYITLGSGIKLISHSSKCHRKLMILIWSTQLISLLFILITTIYGDLSISPLFYYLFVFYSSIQVLVVTELIEKMNKK